MCVKCKLSAGMCTFDFNNPCSICGSCSTTAWGQASEVPLRCQAEVREERNPALVVQHSRSLSVVGFWIYQLGLSLSRLLCKFSLTLVGRNRHQSMRVPSWHPSNHTPLRGLPLQGSKLLVRMFLSLWHPLLSVWMGLVRIWRQWYRD